MQRCTFEVVMREAGYILGNMSTPRRYVPHCFARHCTRLLVSPGQSSSASVRVTTSRGSMRVGGLQ